MKRFNKWATAVLAVSLLSSSCNKFLDVQPTGTLIEDKQFEDLQGFYDALYGVYGKMATRKLYGEHLSWGFVDKLGQIAAKVREGDVDYDIIQYKYDVKGVRNISDEIWTQQYQTISYVNNLIRHCEKTSITSPDIAWIKGEALALRAFMHFDIVRLYCDDYRRKPEAGGIPYAYTFDLKNKKVYNLADSYKNILSDLDLAESLLQDDDEIRAEQKWSASLRAGRVAHLNKFAIKALKARVYNAMGDKANAIKYAREVIASNNFTLASSSNFSGIRRFPAEGELIFGLHNVSLGEAVVKAFQPESKRQGEFAEANRNVKTLYNVKQFTAGNNDVRYNLYYQSSNSLYSFARLMTGEAELKLASTSLQGLCLIRLPEMYYILAGNLYESNQSESLQVLNTLRQSRGLNQLNEKTITSQDALNKELRDEYLREFPGEGLAFYAMKYYNLSFTDIRRNTISPSDAIFNLPWPEKELEFGNK